MTAVQIKNSLISHDFPVGLNSDFGGFSSDRERCKVGLNYYVYVNNNPVNFVDPDGFEPQNLTEAQQAAYVQAIENFDLSSIPSGYDCADTATYIASKAMEAATGATDYYKGLKHDGSTINSIPEIQAKDYHSENGNISFYKDSAGNNDTSFNSSNIKVGTMGVFGANEGANWTGHVMTVTGVNRDSDGNMTYIEIIQGHMSGAATPDTITASDFSEYISGTGPFMGWGEIGNESASSSQTAQTTTNSTASEMSSNETTSNELYEKY